MNNIKAVFFDFDWTLYDHNIHDFTKSSIKAIKKLQENGVKAIINSARSYYSLKGLGTFDLYHFDGFVCSNGGSALVNEDEVLYAHYFNKSKVDEILDLLNKYKIGYIIGTLKNSYIKVYDKEIVDSFYNIFTEPYPKDISEYKDNEEVMVIFAFIKEDKDYLFSNLKDIKVNRFFDLCIEFTPIEFKKDEGIAAILKRFNLNKEECAAFGDGTNDIDMFKFVKYGVAMGNAEDITKESAYYVTSNIEEDGIENGLKYLGLID